MSQAVGIDDMNVYASSQMIAFSDIAAHRGIVEKDRQNLGFECRSVPPVFEDPVTLAVNAAKPVVEAGGRGSYALLIVATETSVDYAKPLSSYVHRYLDLGPHCRNVEVKHACYAGTAAVQFALSWLRSPAGRGRKALVVMADIGRPHFSELAELSVGAGAVAVSLSADPRIVEVEEFSGYGSCEVFDTARPTPTFEFVDKVLSLGAYLDLLELAWADYRQMAGETGFEERFARMVYHTPLMSLVRQAHHLILSGEREDLTRGEAETSFARMVAPSLVYTTQLANTYSANLYIGLAGLLEMDASLAPGSRVGCFSYGSGACAELFSALVRPEAPAIIAGRGLSERLAARRPVSVAEYETCTMTTLQCLTQADFEPDLQASSGLYDAAYRGRGLLVLDRVSNYYRTYKWS